MATEAQLRLLRAVAGQLGAEAVVEVHLFAPIRQGGVESGVAVVAVDERGAVAGAAAAAAAADAPTVATLGGPPPEIQDAIDQADVRNHSSATRIESLPDDLLGEAAPAAPPAAADGPAPPCDPTDDAAGAPPRAAEPDERDDPEPAAPALYPTLRGAAAYRPARYAVYTARYRLTLKGPDRGKWEADVRAEADAPLLTVDAVVRGVQRRAGESADSERLDGEQFRALLPEPEWSGTTSSSSTR